MTISTYKIEQVAEYYALSHVFTNIDEAGWPLEPMVFLENCAESTLEYAEKEDRTPDAEMIPVATYAEWTAADLITLVTELKETISTAIEEALLHANKEVSQ